MPKAGEDDLVWSEIHLAKEQQQELYDITVNVCPLLFSEPDSKV